MQRQYLYSLTAATGTGKTAIGLLLAVHVGLGRRLGDRDVQQGSVLYFSAENSTDVQARWIAMAEHCGFTIGETNVHFVSGANGLKLSEIADRITQEVASSGRDLGLVVVDTSAATFEGDDENDNMAMLNHAKRMRSLVGLRGAPTVVVLTHPVKRPMTTEDLLPRGGGAFIAEVDGNLCARKDGDMVDLHWCGKFRGIDFAPISFELKTVEAQNLRDRKGRHIPTVIAGVLDEVGKYAKKIISRKDDDFVLREIEKKPEASLAEIADALGWKLKDKPYKSRVQRAIERLLQAKLIRRNERRGKWELTEVGEKELNTIEREAVAMFVAVPSAVRLQP